MVSAKSADSEPPGAATVAVEDEVLEFAHAVGVGLTDTPRWLPCRYLYDAHGSELFEEITEQPEYYPTRTEAAILAAHAADVRDVTGPVTLIELGSGSSTKTDHLLAAYADGGEDVHYVAVDVSDSILRAASAGIKRRHPTVQVTPVVGTYGEAFPLFSQYAPSMAMFLGSTIGNFNQTESAAFWHKVSRRLTAGDYFLLGVDLVKDVDVLEAAYNDAAGVTARFTKNLFARMNRELGADVELDRIEHVARYNADWKRIEIFTRFLSPQIIHNRPLRRRHHLRADETVMIEISRKFVLDDLRQFVRYFGFEVRRAFTDDNDWFGVLLLQKGDDA